MEAIFLVYIASFEASSLKRRNIEQEFAKEYSVYLKRVELLLHEFQSFFRFSYPAFPGQFENPLSQIVLCWVSLDWSEAAAV